MKNKGLKIGILALLLAGSIMLYKRGKKDCKCSGNSGKKTGDFEVPLITGDGKTEATEFWIEDGKYWSRCKNPAAICANKEITKEEYDKYYQDFLN